MLDLHRLRLLRELEARHTVRAAARSTRLHDERGLPAARRARARGRDGPAGAGRPQRPAHRGGEGPGAARADAAGRRRGGRGRGRPGRRRTGRRGGPRVVVPVGVPAHRRSGGARARGDPPAGPRRGRGAGGRAGRAGAAPAAPRRRGGRRVRRPAEAGAPRPDPDRPGPRTRPAGAAAGPPDGPASEGPAGGAGRATVGRLPAGHRPPRDADPDLSPAGRVRARPALRLRRLPHPARAGAHHRRVRPAPGARPGLRRARGRRPRPGRGHHRAVGLPADPAHPDAAGAPRRRPVRAGNSMACCASRPALVQANSALRVGIRRRSTRSAARSRCRRSGRSGRG